MLAALMSKKLKNNEKNSPWTLDHDLPAIAIAITLGNPIPENKLRKRTAIAATDTCLANKTVAVYSETTFTKMRSTKMRSHASRLAIRRQIALLDR